MNNASQQLFEIALEDASMLSEGQATPRSPLDKMMNLVKNELRRQKLARAISIWEEDKTGSSMHKFFR